MTQSAPLRFLSTLAIASPLRELAGAFEAASGLSLEVVLDPTTALIARIESGETGDLTALTTEALEKLAQDGTVDRGSTRLLVRSHVGLGVKAGAPKPPIATVEEFLAALHNARSIVYSKGGASGIFFADLIKRLGIEDEINAKATIVPGGFTGEVVARGEAELAVQQVSELMNVDGIDVVGALPDEVGDAPTFSAGVFATSTRKAEAQRLIDFLCSPESAAVIRKYGLEPLAN